MFSTYEVVDGGSILMGNNISYKIVGVGSVRIKMFDGIMWTLIYVWHVPKLKKNMISLGVFDYSDYMFTWQGGILNMPKGTLVVMKAMQI